MKKATLGQGKYLLDLCCEKRVPSERLQVLIDRGLIADLLDANPILVDRAQFRKLLGLDCETKINTITLAGYEFQQITHPDGGREIVLGEFEIDYDEPLPAKIVAGGFNKDCVHDDITSANFPIKEKGKKKLRLALINTGRGEQRTKYFKAMTKKLQRSEGDLVQELEVAKRFPDLPRESIIIAFGSDYHSSRLLFIPVLNRSNQKRDDDTRRLDLNCAYSYWDNSVWALVAG